MNECSVDREEEDVQNNSTTVDIKGQDFEMSKNWIMHKEYPVVPEVSRMNIKDRVRVDKLLQRVNIREVGVMNKQMYVY